MTVTQNKQRSPYFQYDFWYNKQRYFGSTECTTKTAARAYEADVRARARSGPSATATAKNQTTVDQATGEWWELVGKFEGNAKTSRGQIAHLCRLLGEATLLHTIDFKVINRDYIARRRCETAKNRKTLISNTSINRELELARRVWAYARDNKYDAPYDDWAKNMLKKLPKERVRELSAEEEIALFAQLSPDLAAVVEFAMLSSQRRTAVITLLWSRVDLVGGRATVRTKGTGKKTDVDHTFPLTPRMIAVIQGRPKVGPFVFTYVCEREAPPRKDRPARAQGERYPFSKQGWTRKWRKALKDAGIDDFRFHDLRHTGLSRLVRQTGNLKMAMKLANHTDIATTARYAHVLDEDLLQGMIAVEIKNTKKSHSKVPVTGTPKKVKNLAKPGGKG